MRLPHKEPLLFAKKSLKSDKATALVEIDFGYLPTLAVSKPPRKLFLLWR